MNVQDQVRAVDVKRWTTVRTTRSQSVAEHSHVVALISMRMCQLLGRPDILPLCAAYACIHDLDEVITGDIPSPTKRRFDETTQKTLGLYSDALAVTYGIDVPEVKSLVKVAERLEEAWFINEHGASIHAYQVQGNIIDKLYEDFDSQESPLWLAAKKIWDDLVDGKRTW
jgi:5'-deoxynucleotidase YfbR-like HD superfamily hydrolase